MKIERVIVTGGRNFTDSARIEADLHALLLFGLRRVAQGGNGIDKQFAQAETPRNIQSADTLAWLATHALGLQEMTYRPNFKPFNGSGQFEWTGEDGKWPGAGPRRNIRMLEAETPDLVLAYPDPESRGTWHCVKAALQCRIPVAIWHPFCSSADLLDPRNTAGVIDGCGMLRAAASPSRTLYIPASSEARREWSDLNAAMEAA